MFAGTPLERPVTCERCGAVLDECRCPRDAAGPVLTPESQALTVRRQKRRRGKVVTTVEGLDPVASDVASLLRRLKTTCGAGGVVAEGVIEVQGDHRTRIGAMLREAGYPVRVIDG